MKAGARNPEPGAMGARVVGIAIVVLGIFVILTPLYIFPVCGVGRNAPPPGELAGHHACHDTLKAETALGAVSIVIGMVPLLWPVRKTLLVASLAAIVIAVLVILFPIAITGLCKMPDMPCLLGTRSALVTAGIVIGTVGCAGLLVSRKMLS